MAILDESSIHLRQSDAHEDPSKPSPATLRPWNGLDSDEQTRLQIAYGQWLDQLPPTCSLETKIARFTAWLEQQGIDYDARHVAVTDQT